MDELIDIWSVLNTQQKKAIDTSLKQENNSTSRILLSVLTNQKFPTHQELGLSESTFIKNTSLARQHLFELAAHHISGEFSEIELVQKLLQSARIETGIKLIKQLEKQYEQSQKWLLLERLYIETYRYAQITGNEKLLLENAKKRNANMVRYASYSQLSGILMREIIRHEGFSLRPPDETKYLSKLLSIQQKTKKLKHYTLIHNSLYIEYMYLTRFSDNVQRVNNCIHSIRDNCKTHYNSMDRITLETAELNYINYLSVYFTKINPEQPAEQLIEKTTASGNYLKNNLCLTLLEYAAFEENEELFEKWLKRLNQLNDGTKFSPYVHALLAIRAFSKEDFRQFKKESEQFLSNASRMLFPDMQFFIRLLEIFRQSVLEDFDSTLLLSSIKTLKVFASRNLNKKRFSEDLILLQYIEKYIIANINHKKSVPLNGTFLFRNTQFFAKQISKYASR